MRKETLNINISDNEMKEKLLIVNEKYLMTENIIKILLLINKLDSFNSLLLTHFSTTYKEASFNLMQILKLLKSNIYTSFDFLIYQQLLRKHCIAGNVELIIFVPGDSDKATFSP
jgi:hypothetical protein